MFFSAFLQCWYGWGWESKYVSRIFVRKFSNQISKSSLRDHQFRRLLVSSYLTKGYNSRMVTRWSSDSSSRFYLSWCFSCQIFPDVYSFTWFNWRVFTLAIFDLCPYISCHVAKFTYDRFFYSSHRIYHYFIPHRMRDKNNRKKKNASKASRLIDADVLLCGQAAEPVSAETDQVVQHRI